MYGLLIILAIAPIGNPFQKKVSYDRVIFRDTEVTKLDDFNGVKVSSRRVVELYRWEKGEYEKEGEYQVGEFPPVVPGKEWITFKRVRTIFEKVEGVKEWASVRREVTYRTRILYQLEEREFIDERG